jgi:hypothetical protein
VLLFGGNDDRPVLFGETWSWDGSTWTKLNAEGPGPLVHHAMTYDAARDRVVVFGGSQGGGVTDATWEWDGLRWTRIASAASGPSARTGARMAYDAARKVSILYGGDGRDDTWSWDGRT